MKRTEFLLHLISEVAHFYLDADPHRMVISIHQEEDGVHLSAFDDTNRSEEELESIRRSLDVPGRPELAGYYGSLAGFDTLGAARLDLIGWQIKGATVRSIEHGTQIDLWLGGDRFDPEKFSIGDECE
ncbi:MAG: hypothetical protein ACLFUM_02255 [Spirochaetaceae bacterium]